MSFLDILLGRTKEDDNDWIELEFAIWESVGTDDEGLEYFVDTFSAYRHQAHCWWKQKIGHSGRAFDYMICLGSPDKDSVIIPVKQTLSDPLLRRMGKQEYKSIVSFEQRPLFQDCLDLAIDEAPPTGMLSEPPYVTYAKLILQK